MQRSRGKGRDAICKFRRTITVKIMVQDSQRNNAVTVRDRLPVKGGS